MALPQVLIISGSHSPDSQSARLASYLRERLQRLEIAGEVTLHDLGTAPLPLWQEGAQYPLAEQADRADGLILISPEWHGMATPALKNWFLYMDLQWLAHKPVLLCGVSAGAGGLYPVLELRSFSFKNFRPCYLPDQLVVRDVQAVIQPGEAAGEAAACQRRIDHTLHLLRAYIGGFEHIRRALPESAAAFRYGL